jgi:hypothetical protein
VAQLTGTNRFGPVGCTAWPAWPRGHTGQPGGARPQHSQSVRWRCPYSRVHTLGSSVARPAAVLQELAVNKVHPVSIPNPRRTRRARWLARWLTGKGRRSGGRGSPATTVRSRCSGASTDQVWRWWLDELNRRSGRLLDLLTRKHNRW